VEWQDTGAVMEKGPDWFGSSGGKYNDIRGFAQTLRFGGAERTRDFATLND
jgi:hypothetical protein